MVMHPYPWLRCRAGRPLCYRRGLFAICRYCDRQSEVHR